MLEVTPDVRCLSDVQRQSALSAIDGHHIIWPNPQIPGLSQMTGRLVGAMGLPGSGKSTLVRLAAEILLKDGRWNRVKAFVEPEEEAWSDAVKRRDGVGHFTCLTWFRSIRVPMLFEAEKVRADGGLAMIDSMYDKLLHRYLEHREFDWLIDEKDEYRGVAETMAKLDYEFLPDPDVLVFVSVSEEKWRELIGHRGRSLDKNVELEKLFAMQERMESATRAYCEERRVQLVNFSNELPTAYKAAEQFAAIVANL